MAASTRAVLGVWSLGKGRAHTAKPFLRSERKVGNHGELIATDVRALRIDEVPAVLLRRFDVAESFDFDWVGVGEFREDAEMAAGGFNIPAKRADVAIRPSFELRNVALRHTENICHCGLGQLPRFAQCGELHASNVFKSLCVDLSPLLRCELRSFVAN